MSDCCWRSWVRKALKSIRSDAESTRASVGMIHAKLNMIMERQEQMGARQDAAMAKLTDDLNKVVLGWAAKDAKIAALEAAIEAQGADIAGQIQAAVTSALDADDAFDEGVILDADAIVSDLVTEPAPPPVEEPQA